MATVFQYSVLITSVLITGVLISDIYCTYLIIILSRHTLVNRNKGDNRNMFVINGICVNRSHLHALVKAKGIKPCTP